MADNDILIGPGRLWRAPLGTTIPDETSVAWGEDWGGNWEDMGDLIEGQPVTLSMPEDFAKVYTEHSSSPANAVRTRREVMIKCTLAEHTADNMEALLQGDATPTSAGASQKAYTEILFGVGTEIAFYKWGIEAARKDDAGTNQPVRWFFHKGYVRLSGDTAYAKQNATGIPIEITILADKSQDAGEELGILQIVQGPVTPP